MAATSSASFSPLTATTGMSWDSVASFHASATLTRASSNIPESRSTADRAQYMDAIAWGATLGARSARAIASRIERFAPSTSPDE